MPLGDDAGVPDNVVHVRHTHGARTSQPIDLDGSGTVAEYTRSSQAKISIQIDKNINTNIPHSRCRLLIIRAGNIHNPGEGIFLSFTDVTAIIPAIVKGKQLESAGIVTLKKL